MGDRQRHQPPQAVFSAGLQAINETAYRNPLPGGINLPNQDQGPLLATVSRQVAVEPAGVAAAQRLHQIESTAIMIIAAAIKENLPGVRPVREAGSATQIVTVIKERAPFIRGKRFEMSLALPDRHVLSPPKLVIFFRKAAYPVQFPR